MSAVDLRAALRETRSDIVAVLRLAIDLEHNFSTLERMVMGELGPCEVGNLIADAHAVFTVVAVQRPWSLAKRPINAAKAALAEAEGAAVASADTVTLRRKIAAAAVALENAVRIMGIERERGRPRRRTMAAELRATKAAMHMCERAIAATSGWAREPPGDEDKNGDGFGAKVVQLRPRGGRR